MGQARRWILSAVLLTAGCGSDSTAPTVAPATGGPAASAGDSTTGDTGATTAVDLTKVCAVLGPADFKAVGFTVDAEGEDVSENFNLSTTTSGACQWTNFDDNQGGSWELVIGTGDAKAAFESDLLLSQIDTVTKPAIGDEAYLADKVTSSDATDHDFEAGVRIGDTYFTMSTTADNGADAVTALAKQVADQLSTP